MSGSAGSGCGVRNESGRCRSPPRSSFSLRFGVPIAPPRSYFPIAAPIWPSKGRPDQSTTKVAFDIVRIRSFNLAEIQYVTKLAHNVTATMRERPPGLIQHVLTVLVFCSWVLLLPRLAPWSQSLRLFPWAIILLYVPLNIAWICCPQLHHHPCKNGTHSTCFYSTGGHTLRSAPPHTGSPGSPGRVRKESGKSTPGQGPKSAQRVHSGVSKESEKSPKVRF